MPLPQWRELLEKIKHHPIKEAKLMGMGEPFLHPQFDEICKTWKEYFPESFLIVATNCQYKFTQKIENAFKYIDLVYFSIDGYEESYERDRSPAKWSKLMTFLEGFKEVNRGVSRVTCNYVVNPDNIDDIQKVYDEIVVPYGLEELRLNIAQCWEEGGSMDDSYTDEQLQYLKDNWQENIKGKSEWDFDSCFWPQEGLYTTVEGRVLMCALNTGAKSFGNIFEQDLDEIRMSEDYLKVKDGCASNCPTDHCKTCSYKELVPILTKLGVQNEGTQKS
jgi:sulfatase maturation enzyme AslB (radical SAM superfamily)|tara:strand:- start:129 stop:956 length:828 start_codon:yes stop_codon:yes gene_type:complete